MSSSPATGRAASELGAALPDRRIRSEATRPPVDPRLLRLDPAVPRQLVLTALLALLTASALVAQAAALAAIIARTFLDGATLADHGGWILLLAGAVVVRAAASWATDLVALRTATRVKSRLRARALDHLLRRPPDADQAAVGELAAELTEGIDTLDGTFGGYLPAIVRGAVIPVAIVVVLLPIELTSALILLVTLPLIPVFMVLVGLAARGATRRRFRALSELSGHLLAVLEGLGTIRLLGAVDRVGVQVRQAAERLRRTTLETLRVAFLSALVLELLAALAVATVAVVAGVRLAEGLGSFEPVLLALLLAPEAFWPLRQIGQQFHANEDGAVAAERLLGLLEPDEPDAAVRRRPAPDPGRVSVRFEDVRVTYPGRAVPALDRVELRVRPGERLAVLGASGAGKTTLAALLIGLRRPDGGRITAGGVDLAELDPEAWHRHVAWVPQQPARLRGTLADVLRLGTADDARPGDAEVWSALAAVGLDLEVASLPDGLRTVVGPGGRELSTGQWRRVALARALLRPAGLVVLDEPTGDLDVEAELAVRRALASLGGQRTVVVLTHRLPVAAEADRVVVLDAGRVVDAGPPAELADADGAYARLLAASRPLQPGELRAPPQVSLPRRAAVPAPPEEHTPEPDRPEQPHPTDAAVTLTGLLRPHRRMLALATAAGTLTPLAGVLLVAVSTYLISATALRPNLLDLTTVIVGVRALSLLKGVSRYVERLAGHDVALRVVVELRTLIYARLVPKAPVGLGGRRMGDLLARLVVDVDRLQLALVRGVVPLTGGLIAGLLAVVVAGVLLPLAAPVLAAGVVIGGVVVPLAALRLADRPQRALAAARGELTAELVEVLRAAPELRLLGRLPAAHARISHLDVDLVRLDRSAVARGSGSDAAVQLVLGTTVVGLVLVGVPAVGAGLLEGVVLGALVVLGLALGEALAPLPAAAQALSTAASSSRRLREVLDAPDPAPDPAAGDTGVLVTLPTSRLAIDRVTARYPGAAAPALLDHDLELAPGRRVAVVGRSGAGKSTLGTLTVRFLDPEQGELRLDRVPLPTLPGDELRSVVGLSESRAQVFDGTVASNLHLARPGASDDELRRALASAHLDGWVAQLPDGLDTRVGEGGSRLSGGQRHRLALARLLLRATPLLVLDEPTADLDPVTGRALLADALRAAGQRGVLLLTHDLRVLPVVDEVVVLDAGRVVARGPHTDLLRDDPDYAARWSLDQQATKP